MKHKRYLAFGCNDIAIRKFEKVAKTQFLYLQYFLFCPYKILLIINRFSSNKFFLFLIHCSWFDFLLRVKIRLEQILILLFILAFLQVPRRRRRRMERKLWRRFHEVLKGRGREGEEGWMWGVHWSVHGKMREEGGERVGAGCSSLEYKKK